MRDTDTDMYTYALLLFEWIEWGWTQNSNGIDEEKCDQDPTGMETASEAKTCNTKTGRCDTFTIDLQDISCEERVGSIEEDSQTKDGTSEATGIQKERYN
jgi:hypothetical protein